MLFRSSKLAKAARSGYRKKAILGAVYFDETRAALNGPEVAAAAANPAATIPAWVTISAAIIAAMTPLLTAILKNRKQQTGEDVFTDPDTGMQLPEPGTGAAPAAETGGGFDFKKYLPWIIGGGAVLYFVTRKNK